MRNHQVIEEELDNWVAELLSMDCDSYLKSLHIKPQYIEPITGNEELTLTEEEMERFRKVRKFELYQSFRASIRTNCYDGKPMYQMWSKNFKKKIIAIIQTAQDIDYDIVTEYFIKVSEERLTTVLKIFDYHKIEHPTGEELKNIRRHKNGKTSIQTEVALEQGE